MVIDDHTSTTDRLTTDSLATHRPANGEHHPAYSLPTGTRRAAKAVLQPGPGLRRESAAVDHTGGSESRRRK